MRTKRLKITKDNYADLKAVQNQLPKSSKGNYTVREALNISGGAWSYLRQSKDYEHFKELSDRYKNNVVEVPKGEQLLPVFPPEVKVSDPVTEILKEMHQMNITLTRLCMAWESTPQKKGWLK